MRHGLVSGKNVDIICIQSGLKELELCGYNSEFTTMTITHSLNLWRRGEESLAEKTAIDPEFHGISLTSWYRVLAAAKVGAINKEFDCQPNEQLSFNFK